MPATISFPTTWKKRFGFTGASVLAYIIDREEEGGDWFPVLGADMQDALSIHPSSINTARERLRADKVLEVRRVGNRYEYQINHDVISQIEEGN